MEIEVIRTLLRDQPNGPLVDSLRPGSRFLMELGRQFDECFTLEDCEIISWYETGLTTLLQVGSNPIAQIAVRIPLSTESTYTIGYVYDSWKEGDSSHTRTAPERCWSNAYRPRIQVPSRELTIRLESMLTISTWSNFLGNTTQTMSW